MPRNVEMRERVSGIFDHADSLLYPKTQVSMVVGLLDGNGKINIGLLPDAVFDSLYFRDAVVANTDLAVLADNAFVHAPTINRSPIGYYFVIAGNITLTPHTIGTTTVNGRVYRAMFKPAEEGQIEPITGQSVETGDWIVITRFDGAGTVGDPYIVYFAVVNNTYELATPTSSGLLSGADKEKLNGIAAGANNYSHPNHTARSIDTDGIEVLDTFTSDSLGHVTGVAKRSLPIVTTSLPGVMAAADKIKLDAIEANANNYSHPTNGANTTLSLAANETIAGLTVNNLGHVTAATKQTIRTGTTGQTGILQLATGTELTTALSTTKAVTPSAVKTMIDYFAGMIRYTNLAAANAAAHTDGAIVLVTVA
jgi:hypothetical protein